MIYKERDFRIRLTGEDTGNYYTLLLKAQLPGPKPGDHLVRTRLREEVPGVTAEKDRPACSLRTWTISQVPI